MSKYQFLGNFEHVKIKAHVRAELIFGLTLKLENLVEKNSQKKSRKNSVWESASICNYKKGILIERQKLFNSLNVKFKFCGFPDMIDF